MPRRIYGLIFLFNYTKSVKQARNKPNSQLQSDEFQLRITPANYLPELFFARQIATNSCSTHALVSVVMNIPDTLKVDIGPQLSEVKSFMMALPPPDRGETLQNLEFLRVAHNSFTKFSSFRFPPLIT